MAKPPPQGSPESQVSSPVRPRSAERHPQSEASGVCVSSVKLFSVVARDAEYAYFGATIDHSQGKDRKIGRKDNSRWRIVSNNLIAIRQLMVLDTGRDSPHANPADKAVIRAT
jgi:hypothetical protein